MTVEEKVGQLIACRFTAEFRNGDSDYIRELESLVARSGIGGLILFAPARVYETAELANAFQKLAKVPLLLASDFERGAANRVTSATLFPPLMGLGATGSEDDAYAMGDHRSRGPVWASQPTPRSSCQHHRRLSSHPFIGADQPRDLWRPYRGVRTTAQSPRRYFQAAVIRRRTP
jgi:hypothetical protein